MMCQIVDDPLDAKERRKIGGISPAKEIKAGSFENVLYCRRERVEDAFAMIGVTTSIDLQATLADTDYEFGEACPIRA